MSYTFELNNERKDANFVKSNLTSKSPVVEVFSAMTKGKDLSKFGKKLADKASEYIIELNKKADAGDVNAVSELNEIRRLAIEPELMQEIKLLGIYGNYTPLGYEDSLEIEYIDYANIDTRFQAAGQDVPFSAIRKKREGVATTTISGGHAVNYRKASLANMDDEYELQEQVKTQIRNKMALYTMTTLYNTIKNTSKVKYFFEGAGLTKTGADDVISKVRRLGKPTIVGDYALISEFNSFAGYAGVTPTVNGISEAVMNEIHNTGLMGMYNGAVLQELPNPYDLTSLNASGDNFETLIPAGLGYVLPTGGRSPIFTVTRGGITSFSGNDVTTGEILTRYDVEFGVKVIEDRAYEIGLLCDTNLGLPQ